MLIMGASAVCTIARSADAAYVMINYDQRIRYDEHLDIYHCIDPTHHLHIDKIAHGAHLHVTPNPNYSRAIA